MLKLDEVMEKINSIAEDTYTDDVWLRPYKGEVNNGLTEFLFNGKVKISLNGNLITILLLGYSSGSCKSYEELMIENEVIDNNESVSFKSTKLSPLAEEISVIKFYCVRLLRSLKDEKEYILLLE